VNFQQAMRIVLSKKWNKVDLDADRRSLRAEALVTQWLISPDTPQRSSIGYFQEASGQPRQNRYEDEPSIQPQYQTLKTHAL
jgi:hypothetical protein